MLGRNIYKQIGKRIRGIREDHELTQVQLGKTLGLSASYISHLEAGNRNMSLDVLISISNKFDVSLEYLIFGNKSPNKAVSSVMEDDLLSDLAKIFKTEKGEELRRVVRILADNYDIL